jgi:hypothetical protein
MIPQLQNSQVPLGYDLIGRDCPVREKFYINIQSSGANNLTFTLIVPLDQNYEPEAQAIRVFGLDAVDIQYSLEIDLAAEMREFLRCFGEVYKSSLGLKLRQDNLEKFTEEQLQEILKPLVDQGRDVLYRFFVDITPKNYSAADSAIILAALRSAISHPQVICISSPIPLFPWAFLYDDSRYDPLNRSTLNPLKIWGFQHEIQEEFECTSRRIKLNAVPKIISAVCSQVDKLKWHEHKDHPFKRLAKQIEVAPSISHLGEALRDFSGDCLYFFGHAYHSQPPVATRSWLELVGNKLTVSNLKIDYRPAPKFNKDLVVAFLNGCRTAPLTVWNEDSMVGFLCIRSDHRVCCVASVAEVPASFAAAFAEHFWHSFLMEKKPIGDALLNARIESLKKWNNPLGLLYSLFGRVDTRIDSHD